MARKKGSKAFTRAEEDVIILRRLAGDTIPDIAKRLGRGRSAVYRRIERMIANGTEQQEVIDLGQGDDGTSS